MSENTKNDIKEEVVDTELPLDKNVRLMSPARMVMRRFFRSKLSIVGLIMVVGLFIFSFAGPLLYTEWGEIELDESEEEEEPMMQMKINDTPVTVAWEDNESVSALKELAANDLTIQMSMYGGFEQVGPIGQSLPREDRQTATKPGDIVLDTFGGSGTTIVACEQLHRKARIMELDPHYCDVIIARWEKLTGNKATLLTT